MSPLARLLLVIPLVAGPLGAAVLTVHPIAGQGDFLTVQAAVDASSDGDVILVAAGFTYPAFTIEAKSLTVAADGTGITSIDGRVSVRAIASGQRVVIDRLVAAGAGTTALEITNASGRVRIQRSTFVGASNVACTDWDGFGWGRPGAIIENAFDVVLVGSTFRGGDGMGGQFGFEPESCYVGGNGGAGVRAKNAAIIVYESTLVGGMGGNATFDGLGGDGGSGAFVDGFGIVASGTTFLGGDGGIGADFIPVEGYGNGGDGLVTLANAQAQLLDNALSGGAAGKSAFGVPGEPGEPQMLAGPTLLYAGSSHALLTTKVPIREGEAFTLSLTGAPGDVASLVASLAPGKVPQKSLGGVLTLGLPLLLGPLPLGAIPASGTLEIPVVLPELGPGLEAVPLFLQGLVAESELTRLASPLTLVLLDAGV